MTDEGNPIPVPPSEPAPNQDPPPRVPPAVEATAPTAPAGWHVNPATGLRQWWDGTTWTELTVKPKPHGLAIAALVVGGIAFLLGLVPGLGLLLGLAAIVISIIALVGSRAPRWMPLVGIIGGALAVLASIIAIVVAVASGTLQTAQQNAPPVSESETSEPSAPAVASEPVGSLQNPAPVGTTVVSSYFDGTEYEMVLVVEAWDGNSAVAATNQFNDPPSATRQYMLAAITITNTGETPVDPATEAWSISFLGSDNIAVDAATVVAPVESYDVGQVYPTATVSFNLVFEVPVGSTSGIFIVDGSEPFYVSAN